MTPNGPALRNAPLYLLCFRQHCVSFMCTERDSVIRINIHLLFFRFFFIIGYYEILNIVPSAIQ